MEAAGNLTLCRQISEDTVECNGITYSRPELLKDTNAMFWIYLCVYIVLVLFAGMANKTFLILLVLNEVVNTLY